MVASASPEHVDPSASTTLAIRPDSALLAALVCHRVHVVSVGARTDPRDHEWVGFLPAAAPGQNKVALILGSSEPYIHTHTFTPCSGQYHERCCYCPRHRPVLCRAVVVVPRVHHGNTQCRTENLRGPDQKPARWTARAPNVQRYTSSPNVPRAATNHPYVPKSGQTMYTVPRSSMQDEWLAEVRASNATHTARILQDYL